MWVSRSCGGFCEYDDDDVFQVNLYIEFQFSSSNLIVGDSLRVYGCDAENVHTIVSGS
jgi:hypothetical protein